MVETQEQNKKDTKTKFIYIDLQFNDKNRDYLIDEYYIENKRKEHYTDNIKIIVLNIRL